MSENRPQADRPRMSILAILSLVFGVVSTLALGFVTLDIYYRFSLRGILRAHYYRTMDACGYFFAGAALLAILFGVGAFLQIRLGRGRITGGRAARIGLLLVPAQIMLWIFLQVIFRPPEYTATSTTCFNNLKQLGTAFNMYEAAHGDRLPPTAGWNDAVLRYARNKRIMVCPETFEDIPSYAMNRRLNGIAESEVADPSHCVMLFESAPGRNQSGGPELLPRPARHTSWDGREPMYFVLFFDGHAKRVAESEIKYLIWDPRVKSNRPASE